MRRAGPCLALLWFLPTIATADAVMPAPGPCPPGLERRVESHMEVCAPRSCATDAECGPQAACRSIGWCMQEQARTDRDGVERVVRVASEQCEPDGSCPGAAQCERSRRCEPTLETPAWDPEARAWTGRPHGASSTGQGAPADRSGAEGGRGGCATSVMREGAPAGALLAVAGAVAALCRRRRRAAAER